MSTAIPRVNLHAFSAAPIESAALGVLGTIVHPVAQAGGYAALIYRDGVIVGRFALEVGSEEGGPHVTVDLTQEPPTVLHLRTGGHLVLHVSHGPTGYHVVLHSEAGAKRDGFDSRRLGAGDHFVATLLRPGRYRITETVTRESADLVVAPSREKDAGKTPPRTMMTWDGKKLSPSKGRVAPTGSIVVALRAPGAIRVDSAEPPSA